MRVAPGYEFNMTEISVMAAQCVNECHFSESADEQMLNSPNISFKQEEFSEAEWL